MSGQVPTASKHELLEAYLESGMTMVHVDPRVEGVTLPAHLRDDPHVALNLSYRFAPFDLKVTDDEVTATLSFGGQSHFVRLPMPAIFGIQQHQTGDGVLWVEDAPLSFLALLIREDEHDDERGLAAKPVLRAVEGGRGGKAAKPAVVPNAAEADAGLGPTDESNARPRSRAHLRAVDSAPPAQAVEDEAPVVARGPKGPRIATVAGLSSPGLEAAGEAEEASDAERETPMTAAELAAEIDSSVGEIITAATPTLNVPTTSTDVPRDADTPAPTGLPTPGVSRPKSRPDWLRVVK